MTTLHLTHAPVRSSIGVPRAFRSPLTWTDDRRATLGVAMRVMTLRAMVRHQSALVSSCFERCVTNFDTIKMSDAEESCMRKCIILRARYEARVGVLGQVMLSKFFLLLLITFIF